MTRTLLAAIPLALMLSACANWRPDTRTVSREFPARTVTRVFLRAGAAESATVSTVIMDAPYVVVSGVSTGPARGAYFPDPNWRENPPPKEDIDFVSRRYGSTLVISTKNEVSYAHGRHTLENISIMVPTPVRVIRVTRKLTSDGSPDLSAPVGGERGQKLRKAVARPRSDTRD